MSTITTVIASNVAALRTGRGIIAELGDEHYNFVCSPYTTSSIGSHFRHIIDHYECLFAGLTNCHIDYDQRARDPLVEQHTQHALQQLDAIVDAVQALHSAVNLDPNLKLSVSLCTAMDRTRETAFESTLLRELVFLHGHTTHHFSLVAMLMRLIDLPVDDTLGIAPSTLAYQDQSQCVQQ
ncbi:MAG: hypothetical protein ACR2P1_14755 [Pseudomonadales bacterium]